VVGWESGLRRRGPLVNPFDGYVGMGQRSWQFDATTTVDFDWLLTAITFDGELK